MIKGFVASIEWRWLMQRCQRWVTKDWVCLVVGVDILGVLSLSFCITYGYHLVRDGNHGAAVVGLEREESQLTCWRICCMMRKSVSLLSR